MKKAAPKPALVLTRSTLKQLVRVNDADLDKVQGGGITQRTTTTNVELY